MSLAYVVGRVDALVKPARLRAPNGGSPLGTCAREAPSGMFDRQDRRPVAVVVTADGRRVQVPLDPQPLDVAVLALIRSLLSLDGLLGLITGSRRENGGTRRDER